MKIITLKECKDLFPVGSFGSYRMAIHEDDYADDLVLLIEEDCTIENLDLDDVSSTFPLVQKNQYISIILCLGNFTANNIYNDNDDGNCCLTVLGNLTCNNMLVGGQEIFVDKNLIVNECFWGNYNHGVLSVNGKTTATIFLATDEYRYEETKRNQTVNHYFTDFDEENKDYEFPLEKLEVVFLPELLIAEDDLEDEITSWNSWLNRNLCLDYVAKNQKILKDVFEPKVKPEVVYDHFFTTPIFIQTQTDFETQIDNFLKLLEIANLEPDNELEFEKYGWTFTLTKTHKKYPTISLLLATNDDFIISLTIDKLVKKSLFNSKKSYEFYVIVREHVEEKGIAIFEEKAPQSYYNAFNDVWKMVLYHTERGAHFYKRFLNEVKATDVHQLCTLPIITEFYNNWRDGDRNGFHFGGKKYAFCIPNEENGSAQLRISKKIKSKNDNHDCRGFRFDNDTIENPEHVNLLYNYSQCERIEGRYKKYGGTKVYFFDDELYEEALEWYQKAQINVPKVNAIYLEDKEFYINSRD